MSKSDQEKPSVQYTLQRPSNREGNTVNGAPYSNFSRFRRVIGPDGRVHDFTVKPDDNKSN